MGDYFFEKKLRMDGCLETAVASCFGQPTRGLDRRGQHCARRDFPLRHLLWKINQSIAFTHFTNSITRVNYRHYRSHMSQTLDQQDRTNLKFLWSWTLVCESILKLLGPNLKPPCIGRRPFTAQRSPALASPISSSSSRCFSLHLISYCKFAISQAAAGPVPIFINCMGI